MARDFRKPSMTCNALRIPQVPFTTSKENVPWAPEWGSSGIGPDVLLDHRREGRFAQIPVTVDARIDEQVHVMSSSSSLADAVACAGDR